MDRIIRLDYVARPQFEAYHRRTQRFACIVAHRRAGKTVATINDLQDSALRSTKLRHRSAYIAPLRNQAKTIAWDYLKAAAGPLLELGASINEAELRVDYHNGGQVRLHGADNIDALRGIYLDDVVLDEPAQHDPALWPQVIRPALSDRRGKATFIGTPKGRNAFYDIHKKALADPDWYSLVLKASETGLVPPDELEAVRRDLTPEEYDQEMECSFEAAIIGAYYGKLMAQAERDSRITGVAYDPASLVWTSWDLGIRDATAIWWSQVIGREVRILDYYEATGADLGHYVREINARPYLYGGHIVPHDAQAKELGTGKSRLEVLESLGLRNITVAPLHRVEDGINAVRMFLPRCWFDAAKCARGIDALKLYRADYDGKLQVLRPSPVHDWTSHPADSFRYLAMTLDRRGGGPGFNRTIKYPALGNA
jgi:phage terminase large subunit